MKTLDINAKEWLDKVNGNSYFSAEIVVNYGMANAQKFNLPFQYGYGDHYKHMAISELFKQNIISTDKLWELQDTGVIIRANIQRNCKKRELLNIN